MKQAGGISFGDSVKDFARKCKGKQGRARLAAAVGILAMLLILLSELFPQNTAAGSKTQSLPRAARNIRHSWRTGWNI